MEAFISSDIEIAGSYAELMYIMYMNLYGTTDVPTVLLPWHMYTAKYQEDGFFDENAVIPLFFHYSSNLIGYSINSVVKSGGNLHITKSAQLGPLTVVDSRIILIEVKKADIRGVTSVTVTNNPPPLFHEGNLLIMVAKGHNWTVDDFPELDLIAVEQIAELSGGIILLLHLANPGRENVLDAIELLNQRGDIIYAEPNHFGSPWGS
jgi:hypothetical protein